MTEAGGGRDDLALRRSRLSPAKRKLLEQRMRPRRRPGREAPDIPRRSSPDPPPLSFAQERLWFVDQLVPDNPSFNIPYVLSLDGPLDVDALQRGLDDLVARHEILRTTFATVEGRPVQVIAEQGSLPLTTVDLRGLAPEAQQAEVQERAVAETGQPFDLAAGPLVRAGLLRLHRESHVLLLTMHHIVSDEWSMAVFFRELVALYSAHVQGHPSPLAELPIQYADYASWQRQSLNDGVLKKQLAYWKHKLHDAPPLLKLPTDRARPPLLSFAGASQSLRLSRELSDGLRELSRREGATSFMTLLAVWQLLLFRYSGQNKLVVCSGVANRSRPHTEQLIGCFIDILLFYTDLAGDPPFSTLLQRVRSTALEAFSHQDVPFERLVRELRPERDPSHPPFSQVMFVFLNAPTEPVQLEGLKFAPVAMESSTTQYDLLLHMWEADGRLAGRLRYSTDLFSADRISRLLGHFQELLREVVADPGRRLSSLSLLTGAERRQLVVEWNDTRSDFPGDRCLHQLFEAQAEARPDAVAAICGGESLSYGELDRRADRLAGRLRALGVGPEVPVGVCLERSLQLVIGLLGVLKAGGAYLPLDPAYPEKRIRFMLEDGRVPVLLTEEKLAARLPGGSVTLLCLDSGRETVHRPPDARSERPPSPENLVYRIYTSGSTGQPKAIELDHRGRVNNFHDFNRRFRVGPGDRLLSVSSPSFDMTAYDVFGTLAAGAAIVLPEAALERDPREWARLIAEHRVTIWHSAPALLELLVDEVVDHPERHPRGLRLVLLGGDWIPLSLPERLRALAKRASVISLGGATEASMDSTVFPVGERDAAWTSIPYGRPLANQLAYVLDDHLQLVPVGVPGELYLGGVGLARGYLDRPALTAQKFVPDPFGATAGGRLFKTGDLARFEPDGNLRLLGRIDHQVKVRGIRIELGEIETRLSRHPGVKEAVVVAAGAADQQLVAYLVAQQDDGPAVAELRRALAETLPEYMVPSHFVFLSALPLSPNGKLDRSALPAPDKARREPAAEFAPPRTPLEEVVSAVWRTLLDVDRVGVFDDFFELGGHSLLATQITSRIRDIFELEVPLRDFFQALTVERQAELIQALGRRQGIDVKRIADLFLQVQQLTDDEARRIAAEVEQQLSGSPGS